MIRGIFNFCALKLIAYRPTDDLITTVITSRVCEIPSTKYKPMLTRIIRRTSDSPWAVRSYKWSSSHRNSYRAEILRKIGSREPNEPLGAQWRHLANTVDQPMRQRRCCLLAYYRHRSNVLLFYYRLVYSTLTELYRTLVRELKFAVSIMNSCTSLRVMRIIGVLAVLVSLQPI